MLGVLFAMLRRKDNVHWNLIYAWGPGAALGAALAFGAINYGRQVFDWLNHIIGLYAAQAVVAVSVVGLGTLAHLFKKKNQLWYGVCEISFAAVSAFQVALSMKPSETVLAQWATLVAAAYVVARGLNNISEFHEKQAIAADTSRTAPSIP